MSGSKFCLQRNRSRASPSNIPIRSHELLLAVPPDDFPDWTLESLEGSVLEALDLAKVRGADPDVLFGTVPPGPVDQHVRAFHALSDIDAFVLDTNGVLWLEHGPFDGSP